jgi:hypothetical protein
MTVLSCIVLAPDRFQAIALFNANQHEDAIQRVQELAAACPSADAIACRMVEVNINSIKLSLCLVDTDCFDFYTSGVSKCLTGNECLE